MEEVILCQRFQSDERPEGMQPTKWSFSGEEELFQEGNGIEGLAFEEEAVSGFPMPGVRMREKFDELIDGSGVEARSGTPLEIRGSEAVDAALVATAFEIQQSFEVVWDRPRVFDGFAIHIEDVERSIGGMDEIDGAEPVVGGGEKFLAFVDAMRGEGDACGVHGFTVDEVAGDFADEELTAIGIGIGVAPVDGGGAGGGHKPCGVFFAAGDEGVSLTGEALSIEQAPRFGRTGAEDGDLIAEAGDVLQG